ncbi:hypothetical protein Tco_1148399, partial [Tanacetum coccineum]
NLAIRTVLANGASSQVESNASRYSIVPGNTACIPLILSSLNYLNHNSSILDSCLIPWVRRGSSKGRKMAHPILNPIEGKVLVMMDDEQVFGIFDDVSLKKDGYLVVNITIVELQMVDEHWVPKKIMDESLVRRKLEVSNIVEQNKRVVDDTETGWSKMEMNWTC